MCSEVMAPRASSIDLPFIAASIEGMRWAVSEHAPIAIALHVILLPQQVLQRVTNLITTSERHVVKGG